MTTAPTKQWATAPPGLSSAHISPQVATPTLQSLLEQQAAKGSSLWTSSLYQCTVAKPQVASSVLLMPLHHVLQLFYMGRDVPPLDSCSQKPLGLGCLPAASHGLQCLCWPQPQLCLCQGHPTAQQFPTAQPAPAAPALQMQEMVLYPSVQIVSSKSVVSDNIAKKQSLAEFIRSRT